jgi:hypothetical protein
MDDVLPRGRHVQFDIDEYINDFMMDQPEPVMNEPSPNVAQPSTDIPQDEMNLE